MTVTEQTIESYLLRKADWVTTRDLCDTFGINERALRAVGDRPGLCTIIAVSGNKGYKHASLATTREWEEHYARERRHNIMALVNLREKRRRRHNALRQRARVLYEKDSPQALMPGIVAQGLVR